MAAFQNGLFSCGPAGLCFKTCCCPCITYGQTQELQENPAAEPSAVGGDCALFCATACFGFQWVLQFIKRGEMRQKYGIMGSGPKDLLISCCCSCCALIQEHKEVQFRNSSAMAQTTPNVGYQAPPAQGMQYQGGGQQAPPAAAYGGAPAAKV